MSWVLIALLVVPLVGALVVSFLRKDDTKAKLVALAFSLVELVLAVLLWTAYDADGDRIQLAVGVDWIPAFGVRLSFGIDGIALVMIAVIALLIPLVIGAGWTEKLPAGRSQGGYLALILVQEAVTVAVFAATDVFLFYVLWLYQRIMTGPLRGDALVGAAAGPGAVGDPEKKTAIGDLSKREIAVLAPLVVIVLALGFYPQPVLDVITPTVGATLTEVGVTDPVTVQEGK